MKRLIQILTLVLITVTVLHPQVHAQAVEEIEDGLYATRDLTASVSFGRGNRLIIQSVESLRGSIRVIADDVDRVRATYTKQAKATNRNVAIDYIDRISLTATEMPDGAQMSLRAPNPAPWGTDRDAGIVDMEVVVPFYCSVDIDASLFDVDVTGPLAEVRVIESLGRIKVDGVTERLDVTTANRRVTVSNVTGDISVATTNSLLEVSQATAGPGKRAEFRNDEGDIRIEQFSGEVTVRNSYGRIDMTGVTLSGSRNLIRSAYGPIYIELDNVEDAQVKLSNRHEDIEVEMPDDLKAVLSLAVEEDSRIEVTSFDMKPELIERNRLSMIVGGSESLISGSISGKGNIFVRGYSRKE